MENPEVSPNVYGNFKGAFCISDETSASLINGSQDYLPSRNKVGSLPHNLKLDTFWTAQRFFFFNSFFVV